MKKVIKKLGVVFFLASLTAIMAGCGTGADSGKMGKEQSSSFIK